MHWSTRRKPSLMWEIGMFSTFFTLTAILPVKDSVILGIINNYWMTRFCEIQNTQGRGRGYQSKLKTDADKGLTETLIILDITKNRI